MSQSDLCDASTGVLFLSSLGLGYWWLTMIRWFLYKTLWARHRGIRPRHRKRYKPCGRRRLRRSPRFGWGDIWFPYNAPSSPSKIVHRGGLWGQALKQGCALPFWTAVPPASGRAASVRRRPATRRPLCARPHPHGGILRRSLPPCSPLAVLGRSLPKAPQRVKGIEMHEIAGFLPGLVTSQQSFCRLESSPEEHPSRQRKVSEHAQEYSVSKTELDDPDAVERHFPSRIGCTKWAQKVVLDW